MSTSSLTVARSTLHLYWRAFESSTLIYDVDVNGEPLPADSYQIKDELRLKTN